MVMGARRTFDSVVVAVTLRRRSSRSRALTLYAPAETFDQVNV